MSDAFGTTSGGDLDLDAAEYVLGTLDPGERAAFAGLVGRDPAARDALARWERRFGDLADTLDPVRPPAQVWTAIERTLRTQGLTVIEGGLRRAPDLTPVLRTSRNRWRAAALASGGIAAALALFVIGSRLGLFEVPGDTYIAAINRGGDKPALIVRVDLRTRQIFVRPVAAEAPNGRSLELWYIDPGQAPRSMGLIDKATETMPVPAGAKGGAATFAVSVEPPGGSKTGGPTGPVIYSGQLVKE